MFHLNSCLECQCKPLGAWKLLEITILATNAGIWSDSQLFFGRNFPVVRLLSNSISKMERDDGELDDFVLHLTNRIRTGKSDISRTLLGRKKCLENGKIEKNSCTVNDVQLRSGSFYWIDYEHWPPFLYNLDLSDHVSMNIIKNLWILFKNDN